MSWDIHGNPLRIGYCEVHPNVHESWPCSFCQQEAAEAEMYRLAEAEHHRQQQQAAFESAVEHAGEHSPPWRYCSECDLQHPVVDQDTTDNGDIDPRTFHVIYLECGHTIETLVRTTV
jgi:hypothetical protein